MEENKVDIKSLREQLYDIIDELTDIEHFADNGIKINSVADIFPGFINRILTLDGDDYGVNVVIKAQKL